MAPMSGVAGLGVTACHAFASLELGLMRADPALRHAVPVGMRDAQRRLGDLSRAGKPLHDGGIAQEERPQIESCCLERGKRLGHDLLRTPVCYDSNS